MNPTHSANGTYTIDNADAGASRRPFLYCNGIAYSEAPSFRSVGAHSE